MWTASQMKETGTQRRETAAFGVVTAAGAENGVLLGTERRWIPVVAPGGYRWQPRTGDTVLVLKAGEDGEVPCILAGQTPAAPALQPGEVELTGPDCSVKLSESGEIDVQGILKINGRTLEEVISSIVTAAISDQGG